MLGGPGCGGDARPGQGRPDHVDLQLLLSIPPVPPGGARSGHRPGRWDGARSVQVTTAGQPCPCHRPHRQTTAGGHELESVRRELFGTRLPAADNDAADHRDDEHYELDDSGDTTDDNDTTVDIPNDVA